MSCVSAEDVEMTNDTDVSLSLDGPGPVDASPVLTAGNVLIKTSPLQPPASPIQASLTSPKLELPISPIAAIPDTEPHTEVAVNAANSTSDISGTRRKSKSGNFGKANAAATRLSFDQISEASVTKPNASSSSKAATGMSTRRTRASTAKGVASVSSAVLPGSNSSLPAAPDTSVSGSLQTSPSPPTPPPVGAPAAGSSPSMLQSREPVVGSLMWFVGNCFAVMQDSAVKKLTPTGVALPIG